MRETILGVKVRSHHYYVCLFNFSAVFLFVNELHLKRKARMERVGEVSSYYLLNESLNYREIIVTCERAMTIYNRQCNQRIESN